MLDNFSHYFTEMLDFDVYYQIVFNLQFNLILL
jgi:hypothetical protein